VLLLFVHALVGIAAQVVLEHAAANIARVSRHSVALGVLLDLLKVLSGLA
jgi:hypothetical protein